MEKKNFYHELKDVVMKYSDQLGFGWSVNRSQTIIGFAMGNPMNNGAIQATHACICKTTAHG